MTDFTKLSDNDLENAINHHRRQRNITAGGVNTIANIHHTKMVKAGEAELAKRVASKLKEEAELKEAEKPNKYVIYKHKDKYGVSQDIGTGYNWDHSYHHGYHDTVDSAKAWAAKHAGKYPHKIEVKEEVELDEEFGDYSSKKTSEKKSTSAHPDGKPIHHILHKGEVVGTIEPYSAYREKRKPGSRIVSSRTNVTKYSVHFHADKGPTKSADMPLYHKLGHANVQSALKSAADVHSDWLKKSALKENAEQIDELSKATLKSYVSKKANQIIGKDEKSNPYGVNGGGSSKERIKDFTMLNLARKKVAEEVELEEAEGSIKKNRELLATGRISKDEFDRRMGYGKYKIKGSAGVGPLGKSLYKNLVKTNEEVELSEAETNYVIKHKKTKQVLNTHSDYATAKDEHEGLGADKHEYGIYKQTKKDAALRNRNTYREEVEQIAEISKSTLGSYLRKAYTSKNVAGDELQRQSTKMMFRDKRSDAEKERGNAAAHTYGKRSAGISTALKQISRKVREEVEINEASDLRITKIYNKWPKKATYAVHTPDRKYFKEFDSMEAAKAHHAEKTSK